LENPWIKPLIGNAVLLLAASAPVSSDQKILDRISISCGLSPGDIRVKQARQVRIRPRGTVSYEALMCTLPKLKKSGFSYPVGFISQPSEEPGNDAQR
jgi:hypothetical protein